MLPSARRTESSPQEPTTILVFCTLLWSAPPDPRAPPTSRSLREGFIYATVCSYNAPQRCVSHGSSNLLWQRATSVIVCWFASSTWYKDKWCTKSSELLWTFCIVYTVYSGLGSVDGIPTGNGLEGPGIESRWGRDFPHVSRPGLGHIQPPVQWEWGVSLR